MTADRSDGSSSTLPLGPFQEVIWQFWKANPSSPAYSMPEVFHFEGEFDPVAAGSAFTELLRRHEALRTTFHESGSGVVQVVGPVPPPAPVRTRDLRAAPGTDHADRPASIVHAESNAPFDLVAGPVIRLTAITVSDTRTTLVLVAHQIVCDGTSMAVVLHELGELYRAARGAVPPALGPPPPGYPAFVRRQLAALDDGTAQEELAFWQDRLRGARGSALPGRGGTGDPRSLDTFVLSTRLDDGLAAAVVEYARRVGATPFSVALCVATILVAAATGDDDVVLGTAVSGRTQAFDGTVGMLANTVVVRSRIDLSRPFAAVLRDVSLELMDAVDHQEVPFGRVVSALDDPGCRPADVVRTVFAAGANGGMSLGEGDLSDVPASSVEGPFELLMICYVEDTGIVLDWEFARRTYSREQAAAYGAAYVEILAAAVRPADAGDDLLGAIDVVARHLAPGGSCVPCPDGDA